jgi:hypothetical protein
MALELQLSHRLVVKIVHHASVHDRDEIPLIPVTDFHRSIEIANLMIDISNPF